MTLTLELDAELAEVLAEEAARKKMSLPDYAVYLLTITVPPPPPLKTGADVVAYWESEGLIGSRPDITDPEAHSQVMRAKSNGRHRG
ncbi:MAG: hypothetical protein K2X87_06830 [Gemmataceae bacterium]|nr:hypothetical protein [Gemmataceae bacterium]